MNNEILAAALHCYTDSCIGCVWEGDAVNCVVEFAKAIDDHDNKYRWHDLLKYPNDLPEDDSKDYFIKEVWADGDVIYTSAGRDYIVHHGIPTDVYNFTVVAWREIDEYESEDSDG